MTLNTKNILVRLGLFVIAALMCPAGIMVLQYSFAIAQPHIFVMLIFSGSLTFLVGLACLVGLIASFYDHKPPESESEMGSDDKNFDSDEQ